MQKICNFEKEGDFTFSRPLGHRRASWTLAPTSPCCCFLKLTPVQRIGTSVEVSSARNEKKRMQKGEDSLQCV